MANFDSWNKSFIWLLQIKGDDAKAYDTWLIKPNHEQMLWMLVGVEKLVMASMDF